MIINTSIDLTRFKTPAKKSELTGKEFQDHIIKSPTKKQHNDAFSMGRSLLKVPEAEKNKMADEWMRSGGRDPNGRSLDEEIKLGKEEWLKKQKTASLMSGIRDTSIYKLLKNPKVMGIELGHDGIMEAINLLQSSGLLKKGGRVK